MTYIGSATGTEKLSFSGYKLIIGTVYINNNVYYQLPFIFCVDNIGAQSLMGYLMYASIYVANTYISIGEANFNGTNVTSSSVIKAYGIKLS